MIEYIHDAIKISAGQDIGISAELTMYNDEPYTEGCHLMIFDENEELLSTIDGEYVDAIGIWNFTIPATLTEGKCGRWFYCICHHNESLCFKNPLYLV